MRSLAYFFLICKDSHWYPWQWVNTVLSMTWNGQFRKLVLAVREGRGGERREGRGGKGREGKGRGGKERQIINVYIP